MDVHYLLQLSQGSLTQIRLSFSNEISYLQIIDMGRTVNPHLGLFEVPRFGTIEP